MANVIGVVLLAGACYWCGMRDTTEGLEFLRTLQITYEIAANGLWTCCVCGKQDPSVSKIVHQRNCRLQKILGGLRETSDSD